MLPQSDTQVQSNAGIPVPRAGTVPPPTFDQNLSLFAKHPWTSQAILAVLMAVMGAAGGRFVWDDNADAIREVQYEIKEMRKDMERQAEVWTLAKSNQTKLSEVDLLRSQVETLRVRTEDQIDTLKDRIDAALQMEYMSTKRKYNSTRKVNDEE